MRQVMIQVPAGKGDRVMDMARQAGGVNIIRLDTAGAANRAEVVVAHVPNSHVEQIVQGLEDIEGALVSFFPQPAITLQPYNAEVAGHATTIQTLSPVEIFLGGLQSIGSWRGFLAYAVAAGIVVWIGLFTNSSFLLIASMLIAPFAGPAMNAALATARGDVHLLGRSLVRYVTSILVAILASLVLSLALGQSVVTQQMASASSVSEVAVLLPLVAGAAGALNLVQSNRNSLVSGAATGVLVAAALAPPAGLIGMTAAMGRWDLATDGAFLLVLQLVGINLAGALVFRLFGVTVRDSVYERGKKWLFPVMLGLMAVLLVGLLVLQFGSPPGLQRATIAQRAAAEVESVVSSSGLAELVQVNVEFTRPDIPGQNTLIAHVYVQRAGESALTTAEIRELLTERIQANILARDWNVTPLVNVTVLHPPPQPTSRSS